VCIWIRIRVLCGHAKRRVGGACPDDDSEVERDGPSGAGQLILMHARYHTFSNTYCNYISSVIIYMAGGSLAFLPSVVY
jgi:hypothetical protein